MSEFHIFAGILCMWLPRLLVNFAELSYAAFSAWFGFAAAFGAPLQRVSVPVPAAVEVSPCQSPRLYQSDPL